MVLYIPWKARGVSDSIHEVASETSYMVTLFQQTPFSFCMADLVSVIRQKKGETPGPNRIGAKTLLNLPLPTVEVLLELFNS